MRQFEAVIVLADISGYTRFVVMHRSSVMHAEQIVSELMEAVTQNAEFPLTMQKLEGDAAFMMAETPGLTTAAVSDVVRQAVAFTGAFRDKQTELFNKSVGGCICTACQTIENLRLKTIIHAGTVLEKEVSGLTELAGEPVIVAHRLLKNSVERDAYILATETVSSRLDFAPYPEHERYREEIEDVGAVATTAYFPPGSRLDRHGVRPLTRPKGNLEALRLFGRRFISRVQGTGREFHNLPS